MDAGPLLARTAALIGDPARTDADGVDGRPQPPRRRTGAGRWRYPADRRRAPGQAGRRRPAVDREAGAAPLPRAPLGRGLAPARGADVGSAGAAKLPAPGPRDLALRHARTCCDPLAGELAVRLADGRIANGWIANGWIASDRIDPGRWRLTAAGTRALHALEIEPPDAALRRPAVRACLDWSERRPHIGGQLGARVLEALLARGWVRRRRGSRALLVSDAGERGPRRWCAKR